MHKPILFRIALLTLVALATWISSANAWETYSSGGTAYDAAVPGSGHTGNCATCHGDFRVPDYTSLSDGAAWTGVYSGVTITSLHDIHRRIIVSGCSVCHNATGRTPVPLDSSDGYLVNGTQEYTISCLGCHGRAETNAAVPGTVTSAGLRQHHSQAGVTGCAGCHDDTTPAAFTTVGEEVLPPYYAVVDPTRPKPSDSCNFDGNETFAGTTGLDNDGDGLYDRADTDCALPHINLNPAALDFGNVGVGGSSMNSAIENLGTVDLNVTAIALCAGTSAEFTWTLATPFTVAPSASQTLEVTYTPTDVGSDTGCIEITSDDPNEATVQLALSGQSVTDINLNPAALNFGVVATGNSAALNTAIENLGFADLTVSAIALCAGTSAEFSWTQATPFTVVPSASQILEVTYTPVDAGADTGCLEITSDDPDEAIVQLALSSEEEGSNLLPLFIPAIIRPSQP